MGLGFDLVAAFASKERGGMMVTEVARLWGAHDGAQQVGARRGRACLRFEPRKISCEPRWRD
eukprot:8508872-Pyramimonas_sp.AAC.1